MIKPSFTICSSSMDIGKDRQITARTGKQLILEGQCSLRWEDMRFVKVIEIRSSLTRPIACTTTKAFRRAIRYDQHFAIYHCGRHSTESGGSYCALSSVTRWLLGHLCKLLGMIKIVKLTPQGHSSLLCPRLCKPLPLQPRWKLVIDQRRGLRAYAGAFLPR